MKRIAVFVVGTLLCLGWNLMAQAPKNDVIKLPLTEYYVPGQSDYFVVLYTGDGGWRPIDVELAKFLNSKSVSLVGIDSRSYFWAKKTKEEIGHDLHVIINNYRMKWKKKRVVLIGYSFGADISPFAYTSVPEEQRSEIKKIILVAPSQNAQFEIKLVDYLYEPRDGTPLKKELDRIDSRKIYVICDDDENALCNQLDNRVEHTFLEGGHHFNSNYKKLQALVWGALSKSE